jgi:Arc/MetJ-type ribon-helix-helix transcriptional regulator
MEVHLTPDQEAFVRQAIASGRLERAEDALQEAFALWESRERNRAELLAGLDAAEADIAAGHFADHSGGTLSQLATDLKREARALRATGSKA